MDRAKVGQAGLIGWRAKVGERAAQTLAGRTRLSADDARGLLGAIFFAITARSFFRMLRRAVRAARR